jgi:hypothetical protein
MLKTWSFLFVLEPAQVAVSGISRITATLKAHAIIAGIANVEIPVGRTVHYDERIVLSFALVDLETPGNFFFALSAKFSH